MATSRWHRCWTHTRYKEEPNGRLRTGKYSTKNTPKNSVTGSAVEWRRQRKSPVTLKIKQWKSSSLNNREKPDSELNRPSGLWNLIKHIYVLVPEEEEKEGGAKKVFKEIIAEKSSYLMIQEA